MAQALLQALQGSKPLKGFLCARVSVGYHTDDRSTGEFNGQTTVTAAALDGTISIAGKTGGEAWASGKKIKPRAKALRINLRREAREILKAVDDYNRTNRDPSSQLRPELDAKQLTYEISDIGTRVKFFFRREDQSLRVHKLEYAIEDPG
ncbi:MAG: hypothetical protein IPG96_20105 [Proteobacteria bacterium]|nr:hypothetical protein [Pseudomonadota bacterium]